MPNQFNSVFLAEIRLRLLEESWPRLEQCLRESDEKMLWFRPNSNTNSIGNLVLHLEGNVRQWLLHGIGGAPDKRKRAGEFAVNQSLSSSDLLSRMKDLHNEVSELLQSAEAMDLLQPKEIQGFETTVMGALVHVTEHFSYHIGQITFLIKWQKDIDLGYYGDRDLG